MVDSNTDDSHPWCCTVGWSHFALKEGKHTADPIRVEPASRR